MRNRLVIQFSVRDEARFLSHHDTMRLMAHGAQRARVPMAYSSGFNPRPRLSLPLPRPVGVAARQELLVLELAEPAEPGPLVDRLGKQMPEGLTLGPCADLPGRHAPRAVSADYELTVEPAEAPALTARLDDLAKQPSWPCTRNVDGRARDMNLRELVTRLAIAGRNLAFTLTARQQVWARVDEVLALLHLAAHRRADVVRTAVQWRREDDPTEATRDTAS